MINNRHMFRQQISIVVGNAQIDQRTIARNYVTLVYDRLQATRLFQPIEQLSIIKQRTKLVETNQLNSDFGRIWHIFGSIFGKHFWCEFKECEYHRSYCLKSSWKYVRWFVSPFLRIILLICLFIDQWFSNRKMLMTRNFVWNVELSFIHTFVILLAKCHWGFINGCGTECAPHSITFISEMR